jgi:hypothetical protein
MMDWKLIVTICFFAINIGMFCVIKFNDLKHLQEDFKEFKEERKEWKNELNKIYKRLGKIEKAIVRRDAICEERHKKDK